MITVLGDSYSGSDILAQSVSQVLGYRCVQYEDILRRAAAGGTPYNELKDALEKAPGVLDHVIARRCARLALLKAALLEELLEGDVVYHDPAGHLLVPRMPQMLRVRFIAPMEARINAAQYQDGLTRRQAAACVRKSDRDRRRWTRFVYGSGTENPIHYDVVANLETMTLNQVCELVVRAAQQDCFRPTPDTQQEIADLTLASRVHADLAEHAWAFAEKLEVVARGGVVTICGQVPTVRDIEEVRAIARSMPGVLGVDLQLVVAESATDSAALLPSIGAVRPVPQDYGVPSPREQTEIEEWEPAEDFDRPLPIREVAETAVAQPERLSAARMEKVIGWTLLVGVLASTLIVFFGGAVYVDRHAQALVQYRMFRGEPPDLRQFSGIWGDVKALSGRGLIQLGIILLVALQVIRVLLTGALFLKIRDWVFVVISMSVVALLVYGLFFESAA